MTNPKSEKELKAALLKAAWSIVRPYMSGEQQYVIAENMRGEEGAFFVDTVLALAERIGNMPKTYEQDGKGEEAIAFLHYFAGGSASWWITERDISSQPGEMDRQAFGLADLFQDGGEVGYISIAELLENNAELDLYFTPKPLREVRRAA